MNAGEMCHDIFLDTFYPAVRTGSSNTHFYPAVRTGPSNTRFFFGGGHLPGSAKQIVVVSFATQVRACILSDRNMFCTLG